MKSLRNLWTLMTAIVVGLMLFPPFPQGVKRADRAVASAAVRPNVIYILADDLDELVTSPYLRSVMPFTESLRDKGISFRNNFSAVICCEARAAILTGMHAHNNGVFTNGGEYGGYGAFKNPLNVNGVRQVDENGKPIDNENRTFAKLLRDAGYRTSIIGKYLNAFDIAADGTLPALPVGWSDFHVFVTNSQYGGYDYVMMDWTEDDPVARKDPHGSDEDDYGTDVVAGKAVKFLNDSLTNHSDQPVMMYVAPTAPHLPIPPAPRHRKVAEQWRRTLPTNRPNFYADGDTINDKPVWLKATWLNRSSPTARGWTQEDWYNRLGSLYAVDELVKQIYDVLVAKNQLDNTVIVFTSDNGYNLGAHALNHKMAPYEESVRVPLFVLGGKNLGFRSSVEEARMTLHVDHAPTILELAGVAVPSAMDGKSFVPLLRGTASSATWRFDHVEEYYTAGAANGIGAELPPAIFKAITLYLAPFFCLDIPTHRMVRSGIPVIENGVKKTKQYAYIEWYGDDNFLPVHEYELYDVSRDPYELDNLIYFNPSGCKAVSEAMAARLKELTGCSGQSCYSAPKYAADAALLDVSACKR